MGFKCLKAIEPLRGGTSLKKIINKKCFAQFDILFIIISLFKIGCTIALKKKEISLIKANDIK